MDSNAFKGIGILINTLAITCLISVPLGLWKLYDIVMWLWERLTTPA